MESSQQGASPFTVEFAASVADDLLALRLIDRNRVLRKIDEQLLREPTKPTRNKKVVRGLVPPWEHEPPVWELRVGEFRVFYDVSEQERHVIVRAVRHKPPHKTTE
jgi:mRNA-degrading endonuclease RelE of RelBE toxin-antitoxin system